MQKYNGASSCYDNNTKIVHISEATKQENIVHDAGTGVAMIGIDVANITSAKKDESKVDTSREMHLTIDLDNKNNHIKEPSLILLRSLRKMTLVTHHHTNYKNNNKDLTTY